MTDEPNAKGVAQTTAGVFSGGDGLSSSEVFSHDQVIDALKQWLDYGELSYVPKKALGAPGHGGYYRGSGWAARVLKQHIADLESARSRLRSGARAHNGGLTDHE